MVAAHPFKIHRNPAKLTCAQRSLKTSPISCPDSRPILITQSFPPSVSSEAHCRIECHAYISTRAQAAPRRAQSPRTISRGCRPYICSGCMLVTILISFSESHIDHRSRFQGIRTLSRYAFDQSDLPTSQEALRCIANALLLKPNTRQILVDLEYAPKAATKLKVCAKFSQRASRNCPHIWCRVTISTTNFFSLEYSSYYRTIQMSIMRNS